MVEAATCGGKGGGWGLGKGFVVYRVERWERGQLQELPSSGKLPMVEGHGRGCLHRLPVTCPPLTCPSDRVRVAAARPLLTMGTALRLSWEAKYGRGGTVPRGTVPPLPYFASQDKRSAVPIVSSGRAAATLTLSEGQVRGGQVTGRR